MTIPEEIRKELECHGGIAGLGKHLDNEKDLKMVADLFNALSDAKRIKILEIVNIAPVCVCVIKEMLRIPDSKLSYHLNVLKEAGLVVSKQKKKFLFYQPTKLGKQTLKVIKKHYLKSK
jgi:ArsR family transcriptional regulator